ncbi:MAG TPA: S-layer homology domain-containing protein, partial [Bacillota bacterium]|nr:S-layer homology domain-containing protein [Bacillota bacterium]
MNMKKLIATALAVVMIFGLVSVGFAAAVEFPDIEGYEFEAEVRRLASLGVIAGYPDGTFRPEEPVTRAEFAKMIVVMLGLENAANLMKGQAVSFSDVSATHWASGYINVAEMKGVVNGYPDGTFKPEASITYAEALKMILTAMGYLEDGFVVLRWPTTWIIQAAEIGLDE